MKWQQNRSNFEISIQLTLNNSYYVRYMKMKFCTQVQY